MICLHTKLIGLIERGGENKSTPAQEISDVSLCYQVSIGDSNCSKSKHTTEIVVRLGGAKRRDRGNKSARG